MEKRLKCVIVGDGGVGCFCDIPEHKLRVDEVDYGLALWDTAGQDDYDRLRPLSYPQTDVFLLCFSVDNQASFDHVTEKWKPEIQLHCPDVPIILVGTKTDLRSNKSNDSDQEETDAELIIASRGEDLARDIGAVKYVECSALALEGLDNVFEGAVRAAVSHPRPLPKKKRRCVVQ